MENSDKEVQVMNFMAMTNWEDREKAISFLEKSKWDEIQAVNDYLASQHQTPQAPPVIPDQMSPQPERIPAQPQRLMDDFEYYDRQFYGQDPTQQAAFEMPDIMGGIKSLFRSAKDKVLGWPGGREFLNEIKAKYPKIKFDKIGFVELNYKDAATKARDVKKPLFVYMHDHKSDSWRSVDMNCLGNENIQNKLKQSFIWLGSNIFSKDGKLVNTIIDPPLVPFIGIFYVANDGKLDVLNILMGDQIDPESLLQALLLADDSCDDFLRKELAERVQIEKEPDFKLREEANYLERSEHSLSRGQGLTAEVPQPSADVNSNILDPDEEEKQPPVTLKDIQRQEYEEAIRRDEEKEMQKVRDKIAQQEKEEQEQKEKEELEQKVKDSQEKLEEEPEEGNPEVAIIQIRLADGNSKTRRFLKNSTVEQLYLYIRSLGEDCGLEEITDEFELFQQSNVYNDHSKTIEEVGLFPRSKIYWREL